MKSYGNFSFLDEINKHFCSLRIESGYIFVMIDLFVKLIFGLSSVCFMSDLLVCCVAVVERRY